MTSKTQINRKKLSRFLDSLKIRTSEELNERKRIGEKYINVENDFITIKDTTSQALFPGNPSRVSRESHFSIKAQTKSTASTEDDKPKYIPASKYPLPMSPMQYKPAQKCNNASRLLNLSKLRPQRSRSASDATIKHEVPKMSFPDLTIEKIGSTAY